MSPRFTTPLDAIFLMGETPTMLMHVGGLLTFEAPAQADGFFDRMVRDALQAPVAAPWDHRLAVPALRNAPLNAWVPDRDFDITYHVRHSALPAPGGERELGVLVSRLHSNPLDFRRPPWEVHIIEGLAGGRWAVYVKIHHALVDGFTGMRILQRSLSPDPAEVDTPLFYSLPVGGSGGKVGSSRPGTASGRHPEGDQAGGALAHADLGSLTRALTTAVTSVGSVAGIAKAWVDTQIGRSARPGLVTSYEAPRTVLGTQVGRNRRFATQRYDLERFRALGRASGGTINDVLVAVVGGGLRRWLLDQEALPEKPLIAFLPVNVRSPHSKGGGNAVGATLASLGTDQPTPRERLEAVIVSTRAAKDRLTGMSAQEVIAYSGLLLAPAGGQLFTALTGVNLPLPPTFNLCVSNVPGPDHPLHLRGCRLEATYPVSIVGHSMALNITAHSYAGQLCIGYVGCRDSVPRLQDIAVYSGVELAALEEAYDLR